MSAAHSPRPVLATGICLFEAALIILGLFGLASLYLISARHPHLATPAVNLLKLVFQCCSILFTLSGIVLLWQMKGAAFPIFAAKAGIAICVSIMGIAHIMMRPAHPLPQSNFIFFALLRLLGPCLILGVAAMQVTIAWCVYDLVWRGRSVTISA